jgi:hypothetical protein
VQALLDAPMFASRWRWNATVSLVLTPGPRLAALTGNRVLYRDGIPIALLAAGEVRFLERLEPDAEWQARNALLRRQVPSALRLMA